MEKTTVDDLVQTLQGRVATRRAAGEYPPGLEAQLEAEFDAIMRSVHRHELDTQALRERIVTVARSVANVSGHGELTSRVPGGSSLHATVARLVQRHTNTLADTVRGMGNEITKSLEELQRLIDAQRVADERQLSEVVSSILDRIALLDHVATAVVLLEQRVARLEADRET